MQTIYKPMLTLGRGKAVWQSMQMQLGQLGCENQAPARAWLRCIALSAGLALSVYFVWEVPSTFHAILSCILIALLLAQFAFLGHDAGHRSVHRDGFGRMALGQWCMTAITGMAFEEWFERHSAHHRFCQDESRDPDMEVSMVVSLTPGTRQDRTGLALWFTRWQHWHVWFLSLMFAHSQRHLSQWAVCRSPTIYQRDLAVLIIHGMLWFAIPCVLLDVPFSRALIAYLVPLFFLGPYLAAIFWLNHIGMPLVHGGGSISFLEHQAATSRTVLSPKFLDWFFGGLNYQIEHHLFPQVPSGRLGRLQPLVQCTLQSAGVPYNGRSFRASVREVARHFREIAQSPPDGPSAPMGT